MTTRQMLEKLPSKNLDYLQNLRESIRKAKDAGHHQMVDEMKSVGKGYIKGLVDCGVTDNFKSMWCWFTL